MLDSNKQIIKERLGVDNFSEHFYFPKYVEIETVRNCNAHCIMCPLYQPGNEIETGKMDENLFSKITKELSNYSDWVNHVCLSRNGEPLFDKTLHEKIRMLKDAGMNYVTFTTNGSLLNEKRAFELVDSGLDDIRFSIDGATKKTFENIRKGLNFEKVRDNCLRFIQLRNERGEKPYVQIRFVELEENAHETDKWRDYWSDKISGRDKIVSKEYHTWGNQLDRGKESGIENPLCISPFSTLEVLFDGTIPLCGCDYKSVIDFGNVTNSTMRDIWRSEKFKQVRNMHLEDRSSEIPLCKHCDIWDLKIRTVYDNEKRERINT